MAFTFSVYQPYLTFTCRVDACTKADTPSAEATAQAQCATPTDLKVGIEPLRSFGELQEEKPMDVPQRVQRKSVVSENVLSQKH